MKVTKLEHAALIVEATGKALIIDPGSLTTPVTEPGDAVAIVLTHEHADHWTPEQLHRIITRCPEARIFGPAGVAAAATGFEITVVADGDQHDVGPFRLRFLGERHAVIHETLPVPDNVGVLVNGLLFHPGDALTVPPVAVDTLALPSAAPWLKLGEAMDYVTAVAPRRAIPIHDAILSAAGRNLVNGRLAAMTEAAGGELVALDPLQSVDI